MKIIGIICAFMALSCISYIAGDIEGRRFERVELLKGIPITVLGGSIEDSLLSVEGSDNQWFKYVDWPEDILAVSQDSARPDVLFAYKHKDSIFLSFSGFTYRSFTGHFNK